MARIAADNLTPAAHLRMSQLLGGDAPALMVLDSSWADEIRGNRPETASWHYVNIEVGSKGYDRKRDCREGQLRGGARSNGVWVCCAIRARPSRPAATRCFS